MGHIQAPTRIRFLNSDEDAIVSRVFEDTLPSRVRILITNAAGKEGRAFTIPTSLISTILGMTPATFFSKGVVGYLGSAINFAYLMNVGDDAYNVLSTTKRKLLVHEMTHVWQGHNSKFALTYVFNSAYSQCVLDDAYAYTAGSPWSSYNVEQQASIVGNWYISGEPTSGDLFPYIRDHLRKGDA